MFTPEETLCYADMFLRYNGKPVELDRWQELFIQDQRQFIILLKGRQEGFSFAVGVKKFIELQSPAVKNKTVQFVSFNLADAVEKIRYVSQIAHGMSEKRRKKIEYETKTSMEFLDQDGKTTSRLLSIACRPPRGKSGDIVLDEFAIYGSTKAKTIYEAALPSITHGGQVIIGSTPLGKMGMFYEIYANKDKYPKYTRYTVPWWLSKFLCKNPQAAWAAGIKDMDTVERVQAWGTKPLLDQLASSDLEAFQQEYECTFIDGSQSYFPLDLIYANTPGMREGDRAVVLSENGRENEKDLLEIYASKTADELCADYSIESHGQLYMGYDVARRRDAAVIFAIGLLPDGKKISVANIEMINKPFEYQRDQIRMIMKRLPVVRLCIDQGGMGEDTTETLQREFTSAAVEGVMFNTQSKAEMVLSIREGLEKREFLLQNDKKFHRQIHSIKRMQTSGNAIRFDSERDEHGHADSFWAWALANYAIPKQNEGRGFYQQWREKRQGIQESQTGNDNTAKPKGKTLQQMLHNMGKIT